MDKGNTWGSLPKLTELVMNGAIERHLVVLS